MECIALLKIPLLVPKYLQIPVAVFPKIKRTHNTGNTGQGGLTVYRHIAFRLSGHSLTTHHPY